MMEFDDVPMASHGNMWMFIGWVRHRRVASMAHRVRPISRTCRRRSGGAAALARAFCRRLRWEARWRARWRPRRGARCRRMRPAAGWAASDRAEESQTAVHRRQPALLRTGAVRRTPPSRRARSRRPRARCRLPVTASLRAGGRGRAANGPRAPPAVHRAAPRPATLPLRRARSRQLHRLRAVQRQRRAVRRRVSGRLRGLPTGHHPGRLQRQGLVLRMRQRRTRLARHHGNSLRPAQGVRPVVDRLPASSTARRQPARRRNPPRRQRGLQGPRRRRTGRHRR